MHFKAAVLREGTTRMAIEEVSLRDLRPDEVLVRLAATGVCHSDVAVRDGEFPLPKPIIIGHEGSGTVERIGSAINHVKVGDPVVLTYMACGECPTCKATEPAYCTNFPPINLSGMRADGTSALEQNGKPVGGHFFGQSSFATHSVANARNVVKVRADAPLELLGPLGCGVQTGAGSVMNALKPTRGSSLVVAGAGGVGLSAAMAAIVEGCKTVIVVEPHAGRREIAKQIGATHVIDPMSTPDLTAQLIDITNGGVNYAVDATGKTKVVEQLYHALAVRGSLACVAFYGVSAASTFDMLSITQKGLRVRGVTEGDAVPQEFIPKLVDLVVEKRFPLERMVKYYDLAAINQAVDDQASGATIKPIVRMQ